MWERIRGRSTCPPYLSGLAQGSSVLGVGLRAAAAAPSEVSVWASSLVCAHPIEN